MTVYLSKIPKICELYFWVETLKERIMYAKISKFVNIEDYAANFETDLNKGKIEVVRT